MQPKTLKLVLRDFVLTVILPVLAALAIWEALYHGPYEPKDLRYQAWKVGIYHIDLDQATSTMVGDVSPDRLVVGKTKDELVKRFGYLTTIDEASQYVKYC